MDCTPRVPEATLMRNVALALVMVAFVARCRQSDAVGSGAAVAASSATVMPPAPAKEDSPVTPPEETSGQEHEAPDPAKQAELDRYISQEYGDQRKRSTEERELIAFVENFVDTNGLSFPRPRGYRVSQQGDGWNVTMLDLASLRRGDRPKELTYHLRRVGGRLEITHGLVP